MDVLNTHFAPVKKASQIGRRQKSDCEVSINRARIDSWFLKLSAHDIQTHSVSSDPAAWSFEARNLSLCSRLHFWCLWHSALTESVLESPPYSLHVLHTPGSLCATALWLFGPVKSTHLRIWVTTWRASLLLKVICNLTTPPAGGVGLAVPLTETRSTLRHFYWISIFPPNNSSA